MLRSTSNISSAAMVALESLTPMMSFVGEYSHTPTKLELGSLWRQNSFYKNIISGKSFVLTGTPLEWLEYIEPSTNTEKTYYLVIESTNGVIFKINDNNTVATTVLNARLFRNGVEITEETPADYFRWRRISSIPRAYPYDDITWNNLYNSGYKSIALNTDDIKSRATFFCDIVKQN